MKSIAFLLTLILILNSCNKEEVPLKVGDFEFTEMANLPTVLKEASGLEIASPSEFWSFNDAGGASELYQFDTIGRLSLTLAVNNAQNFDWEDITQDENGNLYIGDFGNNDNDRQNLVVYKIAGSDIVDPNNQVTAAEIRFRYSDQTAFPPADSEFHFDVEAMFYSEDQLYLLTRDRSDPFLGKTKLYRLPAIPGNHEAEYIDEFYTNSKKGKGQITAADLSPDGSVLAMISNETLWLFQNISEEDFFKPQPLELDLPISLDMEGLLFKDDCTLYLCNEDKPGKPGILYRIKLCS